MATASCCMALQMDHQPTLPGTKRAINVAATRYLFDTNQQAGMRFTIQLGGFFEIVFFRGSTNDD